VDGAIAGEGLIMACPAVSTGDAFLSAALAHVDCQAQAIGSYGYGALADPGSTVSLALTGLLTLFVAIFGLRLLLGHHASGRDLVGDLIRVGIVLTLATSWPAWRVMGYDLVIHGPEEVARSIGLAADLPGANGNLASRLQRVDDAIAALNERGAGRRGVANGDWFQLGFARVTFLTGTLGPLALVRLTAGILLAIAPLVAGLMLFGATRSIFVGWAKALASAFLAMLGLSLILSTELALVEPWLAEVIRLRIANEQTLGAPTEILIITLSFTLISLGVIAVMARIAFHPAAWTAAFTAVANRQSRDILERNIPAPAPPADETPARARAVASAVAESINREVRMNQGRRGPELAAAGPAAIVQAGPDMSGLAPQALGSSFRRTSRRVSGAGARRDQTG
jgi:type IV secretion system protein VirB6